MASKFCNFIFKIFNLHKNKLNHNFYALMMINNEYHVLDAELTSGVFAIKAITKCNLNTNIVILNSMFAKKYNINIQNTSIDYLFFNYQNNDLFIIKGKAQTSLIFNNLKNKCNNCMMSI